MPEPSPASQLSQFLAQTALFGGLPDALRDRLAGAMALRSFAPGQDILRQGDAAEALYLLLRGRAQVLADEPALGLQQEVGEVGPGSLVGEIGLLLNEPRTATIRAIEPTTCAVLHRNAFNTFILDEPIVGLTLSQNLARLVRDRTRSSGFPVVQLREVDFDPDLYDLFPRTLLRRHEIVPIGREGRTILLAMTRPGDAGTFAELRRTCPGLLFRPLSCTAEDYERYYRVVIEPSLRRRPTPVQVEIGSTEGSYRPGEVRLSAFGPQDQPSKAGISGERVIEILNGMLAEAVNQGASDIHIEPGESVVTVRFRVNGSLMVHLRADAPVAAPLISRIKVAAGLDIAERRRPQDGRLQMRVRERRIELRVSTIPTLQGEKAVMRLLDTSVGLKPLEQLLYSQGLLASLRRTLMGTSGCIIVCGPTGSGKTTTLYSALHELVQARPDINISTIENPVEYSLEGITQTGVNEAAGVTFPAVLRAILRQDPDVIMVGEMRDELTAHIALEASLTGHLVLSTVHANTTSEAALRLVELGCPPYLVASALSLVIGQRLVRRLCPHCRRKSSWTEATRAHLAEAGILPLEESEALWMPVGCPHCQGSGWLGRVAVYEFMQVNDRLREAIAARNLGAALRQIGSEDKVFTSFKQYSAMLLLEGWTTPPEVLRQFGS